MRKKISETANDSKFVVQDAEKQTEQIVDSVVTDGANREQVSIEISNAEYQQNFEQEQRERKKSNKIWFIIGILFNIIALTTVFIVEQGNGRGEVILFSEVLEVFKENYQWVILAVVAYLIIMLGDGIAYLNLIHCTTRKYRLRLGVKLGIVGRYYDNITPLATGGQPFQIYTLTKSGIDVAKSSSIALSRYIIRQFIFTIVLIAVFIYTAVSGLPFEAESHTGETIVKVFAYIGIFFTCLLPVFFLLVSINKNLGHGIIKVVIKFLSKIRLVKNYEKTLNKTITEMDRFQASVKYVMKRKRTLFLQILLAIIETLVFTSIPYLVYRSFGCTGADWIAIASSYIYCLAAVTFFPTPGTAGAAEASFYVVFASFFTIAGQGQYVFWALIMWRFFTYYIFILVGLTHMLVKYTIKAVKHKKATARATVATSKVTGITDKEVEKCSENISETVSDSTEAITDGEIKQ